VRKHVGENAELYALGMLDEPKRVAIDAHVATCSECARALGDAERTVMRVVAADAPRATPASLDRRVTGRFVERSNAWRWLALAAAVALLVGAPIAAYLRGSEQAANRQSPALMAIVGSHFVHAPFVPVTSDAPKAKVLLAKDGSWFYVIARTAQPLRVTSEPDGALLGSLQREGDVATLFVSESVRVHALALRDGQRLLARVKVVR
jgi:putative zinc finger protein